QPRHVPAVGEQALSDVAAADPGHADDERAAGHCLRFPDTATPRTRSGGAPAGSPCSCPASAPRRPRTTQIARTVSGPSLLSRCGVDDGKVIESPGSRTYSSKPTTTRSVPLSTCPNSCPLWRTKAPSGLDAPP